MLGLHGVSAEDNIAPNLLQKLILGNACPELTADIVRAGPDFSMYPTATKKWLNITLPDFSTYSYRIINSTGSPVAEGVISGHRQLDVVGLSPGIYYLFLVGSGANQKFIRL